MGRTFIRQDAQIRNSVTYDDTLSAGSTLESAPTTIEGDLNGVRSQIKRLFLADASGDWFQDVDTVNSKKRGVKALNTDLDDLEEKRLLFRADIMTDIVVPSNVKATGVLTLSGNAANTETVTTGTKTYTFQTSLTNVDGNVLIGATASDTIDNLIAAITLGAGSGTVYAAATTANGFITATAGAGDTMNAEALLGGTQGNATATTETMGSGSWGAATLTGGTGDMKTLVQASSETPTVAAAVGAGTAEGALVALLAADVGAISLNEISGPSGISPKNLCLVRDGSTGDPITSSSREVYALLQAETGVADGEAFNDSTKQCQLSFVRVNSTGDDLEFCPSADIAGKTINYAYVRRVKLDNVPEYAFLTGHFLDQVPTAVSVTLDNAIDNQVGAATQTDRNIDWRITDTFTLKFQDSPGTRDLLAIIPGAGGDEIELNVDTLDINNALDADFLNGATFDSGGTPIRVGVTAGYIDTAASDLGIRAGAELLLDDANQAGSTWAATAGIKLSDTTAEWDDFEVEFGEVSLLNAIVQAKRGMERAKTTAVVTTGIAADTNVTGGTNLDVSLPSYNGLTFVDACDVYLNGELLRNGADASANNDVYPGTTPANGDLKFEFPLVASPGNPDTITMIVWGQPT